MCSLFRHVFIGFPPTFSFSFNLKRAIVKKLPSPFVRHVPTRGTLSPLRVSYTWFTARLIASPSSTIVCSLSFDDFFHLQRLERGFHGNFELKSTPTVVFFTGREKGDTRVDAIRSLIARSRFLPRADNNSLASRRWSFEQNSVYTRGIRERFVISRLERTRNFPPFHCLDLVKFCNQH